MKAAAMLLGAVAVAYIAIVLRTAWSLISPRRDYSPEGYVSAQVPFESVAFKSRIGLRRAGWLAITDDAPGTIVLCHGVWTNHREMESRAEALWDRGFSVMTFDFQGSGDSEGRFTTLGLREVGDLLGALDFLSERTGVGPIGVLGNSMGGAVGLLTAARDSRIACVATDGAFAAADYDFVAHAFHGATGLTPGPFQDAVVVVSELLSGARLDRVRPVDAIGAIAPRPVLLVHGTEDELVSADDAQRLHEAANDPKDLWIVPGARHVESFQIQREEYLDRMERFFRGAMA